MGINLIKLILTVIISVSGTNPTTIPAPFVFSSIRRNDKELDRCLYESDANACLTTNSKLYYIPTMWNNTKAVNTLIANKIIAPSVDDEAQKRVFGASVVTIPFEFDSASNESDELKNLLKDSIKFLKDNTCINFAELKDNHSVVKADFQYLKFSHESETKNGCRENVGRKPTDIEFPQEQIFHKNCLYTGSDSAKDAKTSTQLHYLMHILGFDNEVQRPDVGIHFEYTKGDSAVVGRPTDSATVQYVSTKEKWPQWNRRSPHAWTEANNMSTHSMQDYDKASVMHWNNKYLTYKSGKSGDIPHMRLAKNKPLSPIDLKKINLIYRCVPNFFKANIPIKEPITEPTPGTEKCYYKISSSETDNVSIDVNKKCLQNDKQDTQIYVEQLKGYQAKITYSYNLPIESDTANDNKIANGGGILANPPDNQPNASWESSWTLIEENVNMKPDEIANVKTEIVNSKCNQAYLLSRRSDRKAWDVGVECGVAATSKTLVGACNQPYQFRYINKEKIGSTEATKLEMSVKWEKCKQQGLVAKNRDDLFKASSNSLLTSLVFLSM